MLMVATTNICAIKIHTINEHSILQNKTKQINIKINAPNKTNRTCKKNTKIYIPIGHNHTCDVCVITITKLKTLARNTKTHKIIK
jgi:hypothetical protein